jgi:hypothetical protein
VSSSWYAPNQQAVRADGSGPAEEGTGGSSATTPKPPPAGQAPAPGAATGEDLDAMTKDELLHYAEQRGVDVDVSMTKAQIREAIGA